MFPRRKLKSKNPQTRRKAAQELGSSVHPPAVEPLIAALRDHEPDVRGEASEALGKLGDAWAVGPLIAALGDPSSGRSTSSPFLKVAPARTRATRSGAFTALPSGFVRTR